MQINAGMVCDWWVSAEFLIKALRQIEESGAKLLCVVDDKTGTVKNGFVVYYKNPPAPPPPSSAKAEPKPAKPCDQEETR